MLLVLYQLLPDFEMKSTLNIVYKQKLSSVMDCECCCREQPISKQKIFFTAISLDAHNNNIRNPSQNSALVHRPLREPAEENKIIIFFFPKSIFCAR